MASSGSGKRHRIRAHINPLAVTYFDYPRTPAFAPWHEHFPHYFQAADEANAAERACVPVAETGPRGVTIADVGCGFGGLLETLAPLFPDQLILGLEIRDKVVDIVKKRIAGLRAHAAAPASAASAASAESTASTTSSTSLATPPPFGNISVLRSNAMKHLINYFHKGQLEKIFFCFADPHFKKSNHRRRIISYNLLSEYAYVLREGGIIYTITDVRDLHDWMAQHLNDHPLFERIDEADLASDPCVEAMTNGTDEAQKVSRNGGSKFTAVFRRIAAPQ